MKIKFSKYVPVSLSLLLLISMVYLISCDSRTGVTDPSPPPPPPTPNPYGEGNGKITFYRTENIDGPVIIKISDKSLTDSLVWTIEPNCDTGIAASVILKKGGYGVYISGTSFSCSYGITISERQCIRLNYTGCAGGSIPCTGLNGTWLRTADGPCPNCEGLKVYYSNGFGEVIYTPPGCRFPIGDIKWINYDSSNCYIQDLARDDYGGSPEYQNASTIFYNRNSYTINGQSGVIPYSRISNNYDKSKPELKPRSIVPVDTINGLRPLQ